ncbi:MAG: ABC transporter ATP-binding protein [Miltoncostaeaceae bacterium]
MRHAIETTGLTKQWADLVAVDDLSISVQTGECYAFLGRNGSGKSTTARMLLDFIRPTSGTSRVLGGSGSDPSVRARVGYLPGDLNLAGTASADDAFRFFGGLSSPPERKQIDDLVERFGLDPTRPVRELSTGNRRKVGLILAFMGSPELLILDEPTSGLDPVLQEEFRELLAERKADGATIWLTSHVMAEVERVADRVGLIQDGHLAQELTMADLRRQTTGRIVFTFATPPDPDAFRGLPGVTSAERGSAAGELAITTDGSVAAALAAAGELGATAVRTERRDLDDVFLDLFEDEGR